jgi:anti-sigma factor RsiW
VNNGVEQLSCQELVELMTDYFEGALSPEDVARFDAHIEPCDGCSTYLEQMRTTIELTGTLERGQIEPRAGAALLDAFRDWNARLGP